MVVGTRSAVFLPLPHAGLIVIDEEHDGSFKQLDGIRYHARDFALVRAKALDVPIVLGSATPSLESLRNAQSRTATRTCGCARRAGVAQPPRVRVLDVRKRPLEAGMSPELFDAIAATLRTGGQALVFKNRRGYAPVLLCHDCGWSAQCKRCSTPTATPMTVHAGGRRLQCHHCGARRPAPDACPDCGGLALQSQGAGTERIEEALAEALPRRAGAAHRPRHHPASRRAGDNCCTTSATRPASWSARRCWPRATTCRTSTLVAVVGIDEGLFSADFRAREKLAQLLIQVAGRAGRAARPGEVLLQTHHPEHPLLETLLGGGYHAFADAELAQREAAGFPPFAHLALLRAEAQQVEATHAFLQAAKPALHAHRRRARTARPAARADAAARRLPARAAAAVFARTSRPACRARCRTAGDPRLARSAQGALVAGCRSGGSVLATACRPSVRGLLIAPTHSPFATISRARGINPVALGCAGGQTHAANRYSASAISNVARRPNRHRQQRRRSPRPPRRSR